MTNEELHMLKMQELCARLPFGVKVRGVFLNYNKEKDRILYEECDRKLDWQDLRCIDSFKLYLRPMSSMTEEEKKEFDDFCVIDKFLLKDNSEIGYKNQAIIMSDAIDWLNKKMFDYRGLIPMGLALPAPEGMYKGNTK